MIDLRQTQEYTRYMESLGWKSLQLKKAHVYLKKIPLVGSVAKLQRPHKIPTAQQIRDFSKKHGIAVFYLEPQSPISPQSLLLHFAKNSFVPAKTIQIDLQKSENELLSRCKAKTRYNIGLAKRRGVIVKRSADISRFCDLCKSASRERGMWLPQDSEIRALWDAFSNTNNADLLVAHKDAELLGGVFVCYSQDTAYYMYAGSTKKGKKLFAPTLLAREAIRFAKKRKKKIFDFEGIYDERYPSTKTWRGFTKFKGGFGGKVVEYPKTLAYYRNPLLRILGI